MSTRPFFCFCGPLSKSDSPEDAEFDFFQLSELVIAGPFLLPFLTTAREKPECSALFAPPR